MCGCAEECFGGVEIGQGTDGPQGPVGPTGPQGPTGPAGEVPELANKMYYYKTLEEQRPFTGLIIDLPVGVWMQNQVAYHVKDLDLKNLANGTYLVNCNLAFGVGWFDVTGNKVVKLNYELRLNEVVIPFSTRNTYRSGGTPEEQTAIDGTVGEVAITSEDDTIQLWVYVDSVQSGLTLPTSYNVVVLQSGTIWAHRLLVTN